MAEIQPGYGIIGSFILNSSASREPVIDFNVAVTSNVEIVTEYNTPDPNSQFMISLIGTLRGLQNEKEVFILKCKMAGIFVINGEPELAFDAFVHVNGPAIIYPFMREFFSDQTRRMGLNAVFLPPLNFTKRDPDKLDKTVEPLTP